MMNNDSLMPTNVSNVIETISSVVRNFTIKETEWLIQKEEYERKLSELEGELKAHENINIDLLKRIRMLEYSLGKEREHNTNTNTKQGEGINNEKPPDNLFSDLGPQNLIKEEDLKMLKERSSRQSLISVFQSIGIDENLANNLFTDFDNNRTELEVTIKKMTDEKLSKILNNVNISNQNQEMNQLNNNNQQAKNSLSNTMLKGKDSNPNNSRENSHINTVNNIHNEQQNQTKKEEKYTFSFNKSIELRSHFDEVRKLCYLPDMNSLVSVSEDCLIKVWSLKNISYNSQNNDIEPYLTLRGHTGPLYCTEAGAYGSNLIYTGGNEGIIQIWNIARPEDISQYCETENLQMSIGFFQKPNENETIWDLKHHPTSNVLISLSSDGSIYFWETTTADEFINQFNMNNYDRWLKTENNKKNSNNDFIIPTTSEFLKTDSSRLIVGFNDATISILDVVKNSYVSHFKTMNPTNDDPNKILYQPNCFAPEKTAPIIYTGFEDSTIKIVDLRTDSITTSITAHGDAVASLNLFNDIHLFSISHDTTIKLWDVRKMNECVQSVMCSQKKWDEAMWDSVLIENSMTLCVACADCTVKLYKL